MTDLTGKGKPFHSALDKAAALLKRKVGTGAEFMKELQGLGGIKQAEMDERKLGEVMGMPRMTHDQFMANLAMRPIPAIQEKVLGGEPDKKKLEHLAREIAYEQAYEELRDEGMGLNQAHDVANDLSGERFPEYMEQARRELGDNGATYHDKYTLKGGDNYREMLIKAPKSESYWAQKFNGEKKFFDDPDAASRHAGSTGQAGRVEGSEGGFGGVGAHFGGEGNILASMRLKDRTGPNGEKLLHLEELQSDWHQQGRDKGYKGDYESEAEMIKKRDDLYDARTALVKQAIAAEKTGGTAPQELIDQIQGMNDKLEEVEDRKNKARSAVPDAPFKKNWEEMALKRLVHHAAEKGYHGIVVTTGAEQADRYSLAKQVDNLFSGNNGDGTWTLSGTQDGRSVFNQDKIPESKLADYVGKEAAEKIIASGEGTRLSGLDLQVGGEGMKGFYDKKVPNILNSIGKKHGVKTELHGHNLKLSEDLNFPPNNNNLPQHVPGETRTVHHFPITEDMRKDIMANGLPLYKEGGNVKAKTTEQMRQELSDKYKPVATKASEALGKHEGKHLKVTQADRTKVGEGFLGGPGFSSLQHVDPDYAGAAWGVNTPSAASKIINANKGEDSVWSTIIGAPNQHSSNQMVFDMLLKQFKAAIKAGKMTPELRAAFNDRLAAAADNKGKPIFNRGTDIAGKNFFKDLDTFDRRRAVADLMGGKAIGGKKGQIFDYDKIMRSTTEPELLDAPTHAIGPRLFKLSGARSLQPNLHPAFPHILHGEDTGQMYHPVPRDVMLPDFHETIRKTKGRDVGFMDLTRNTPTQQLTEKFLTQLQKRGYADGGQVQPDISQIGAEEAPNMQVKAFVIPHNGAAGSLPMGGVDMSPQQPGQQMVPANMLKPQPNPLTPQQPPAAGAPAPAGGSNILQMTPQGQAMAAMKPPSPPMQKAIGGSVPMPVNNNPFQSAGHKPLPFMAKMGGSSNMPMNNNYSDNGATDFSIDNIQQLKRGGSVSVASMQQQIKSMAQQINKLTDNLDTMRLALTRNKKAK